MSKIPEFGNRDDIVKEYLNHKKYNKNFKDIYKNIFENFDIKKYSWEMIRFIARTDNFEYLKIMYDRGFGNEELLECFSPFELRNDYVAQLVDIGYDLNYIGKYGLSIFHRILKGWENKPIIDAIENGADINVYMKHSDTIQNDQIDYHPLSLFLTYYANVIHCNYNNNNKIETWHFEDLHDEDYDININYKILDILIESVDFSNIKLNFSSFWACNITHDEPNKSLRLERHDYMDGFPEELDEGEINYDSHFEIFQKFIDNGMDINANISSLVCYIPEKIFHRFIMTYSDIIDFNAVDEKNFLKWIPQNRLNIRSIHDLHTIDFNEYIFAQSINVLKKFISDDNKDALVKVNYNTQYTLQNLLHICANISNLDEMTINFIATNC